MKKKLDGVVDNIKWLEDKNFYLDSQIKELTKLVCELKSRLDFVQDELCLYQPYEKR